jgi:pyruvyltransferase
MPLLAGRRATFKKMAPRRLAQTFRAAVDDDVLIVDWINYGHVLENWGDAVAPHLVEKLSGRPVVNNRDVFNPRGRSVYTTIGSMLGSIRTPAVEVWGSGLVNSDTSMHVTPRAVHAVRGPLTRDRLLSQGISCPEIYGDPALLYAKFHRSPATKTHRIGIIPHIREQDMPAVARLAEGDGVKIIDITGSFTQVADGINSCEVIASSSLHGLVCADGYGVPTTWIRFSDRPFGDGFKFRDYLLAAGAAHPDGMDVVDSTTIAEIEDRCVGTAMKVDLDAFVDACPFLDRDVYRANCVD